MIVPWSRYWASLSLLTAFALLGMYWVMASLAGGWWLHAGRDRFPLSPEAIERIRARKIRKQARDEERDEQARAHGHPRVAQAPRPAPGVPRDEQRQGTV